MADEKSEIQDFLEKEGKPETVCENKEVQVEEHASEKEEAEEKPLPFYKDPKVQRYIEKQVAKQLSGVQMTKQEKQDVQEAETPSELISALTAVIGNDTPEKLRVLKAFEKEIKGMEEKASERAIERFQAEMQRESEQEAREVEARREELAEAWDEIENKFNVDLSSGSPQAERLDTEFRQYIRKISHKNADGEVDQFPDLVEAFEEFQEKRQRPNRAKELASRGMTRSSDASAAPKPKDTSWRGVEKLFDKLKS